MLYHSSFASNLQNLLHLIIFGTGEPSASQHILHEAEADGKTKKNKTKTNTLFFFLTQKNTPPPPHFCSAVSFLSPFRYAPAFDQHDQGYRQAQTPPPSPTHFFPVLHISNQPLPPPPPPARPRLTPQHNSTLLTVIARHNSPLPPPSPPRQKMPHRLAVKTTDRCHFATRLATQDRPSDASKAPLRPLRYFTRR